MLACSASERVAATARASCKTELAQERLWLVGGDGYCSAATGQTSPRGGLTELCPAIGSGAAPKGHGGPKVCALAGQGAMAALRGQGAEKRWIDA